MVSKRTMGEKNGETTLGPLFPFTGVVKLLPTCSDGSDVRTGIFSFRFVPCPMFV